MFFSFKNFLKATLFLFSILIIILIFSSISYYLIEKNQIKKNVMDIEEYSPISTLKVPENPIKRAKFPFVDVHSHQWNMAIKDLSGLVKEMNDLNMKYMINLSGSGVATFSGNQSLMDLNLSKSVKNIRENYPRRFGVFVNLKFNNINDNDFGSKSAEILENAVNEGAIGLKIYKNLGLDLKDSKGNRVKVDDKRLYPIWEACAKLNIPVLIHSGEPSPFFDPVDKFNERFLHARQKPKSFRPPEKYPSFDTVMNEQYNMFKNNPKTIFINAHMGWMANDLDKLEKHLDSLPNVYTEIGAMIGELGRQPRRARKFFIDYQDRIMFGKDSYKKSEFDVYFRVLETDDEYFDYYRKRHGLWKMYGLNLPDEVLKKVYYKNALKLFPSIDEQLFE
ncbi:MAG: amidohydrolase [Flavobacteriaceae bacterium]|nr:amidohydrolase [Flavobacteriaceae bacterium]RCL66666.1 MAG: amidohydrolase [Cryomorphaceae bacterium]